MSTPADVGNQQGLTRILFVGDVFGRPGRKALSRGIERLTRSLRLDAIIVNGENLAGGKGLNLKTVTECFEMGVTAVTTGNHLFDQKNTPSLLETEARVLRPLNLSPECPGKGASVYALPNGKTLGLINLIGRVFMAPSDCPFHAADRVLEEWGNAICPPDLIVIDFHGEASGEKRAMGFHLDGRVNLVYGTHTHVQSNDLETLPGGTLFLTDLGLTGPRWSVIGVSPEMALKKYLTHVPAPFEVGEGELLFCALLASFVEVGDRMVLKEARLIREGDRSDES
ncbi:MAG: TIGR00282 family metallophosphoesterase [Leptospirales bacterium]